MAKVDRTAEVARIVPVEERPPGAPANARTLGSRDRVGAAGSAAADQRRSRPARCQNASRSQLGRRRGATRALSACESGAHADGRQRPLGASRTTAARAPGRPSRLAPGAPSSAGGSPPSATCRRRSRSGPRRSGWRGATAGPGKVRSRCPRSARRATAVPPSRTARRRPWPENRSGSTGCSRPAPRGGVRRRESGDRRRCSRPGAPVPRTAARAGASRSGPRAKSPPRRSCRRPPSAFAAGRARRGPAASRNCSTQSSGDGARASTGSGQSK